MSLMQPEDRILVCGAGGFIGGHMVRRLKELGHTNIRAIDIKPMDQWYQLHKGVENIVADLRVKDHCARLMIGADYVFNLAADMGGMGFIESHKADCMLSVLINTHLLMAARDNNVKRFFYASSACVYAGYKQTETNVIALKEADAYPADPEDGYGWEKLFSERMCRHFTEDFGLQTRVARYHNVYGPNGTWDGGREKAPAAICRKVITAVNAGSNDIEIWGDGKQTRSFMYIDDCINGTLRLFESDVREPLNIGSSELVSIDELVSIVEAITNARLTRRYDLGAPKGVRGRNSDNTLIRARLGWEPQIPLRTGMASTYEWIREEIAATARIPAVS
jgi:nucleoside-diphosphate-sugar epimerase